MEIAVRDIGNSKGIIIPKYFLDKYNFKKMVEIKEGKNGLIIKPVEEKSLFQKKLDVIKLNKYEIYDEMRVVAERDDTKEYYKNDVEGIGDIDLEILEA